MNSAAKKEIKLKNSFTETELRKAFVLRVSKGNELNAELKRFCREHEIRNAWLNVLGGFSKARIYFAKEIKENKLVMNEMEFNELLEFHGTGSIAVKEGEKEITPHVHVTVSKKSGESFCGHLMWGEIGVIAEVFLQELSAEMKRIPNKGIYNYPALTMEKEF